MYRSFWMFCSLLLLLISCSAKVAIINGIEEREANEIVVFLASKGIPAEKEQATATGAAAATAGAVTWNIYVDSAEVTEAIAILNYNGLPRKQGQDLLQIFGAGGLIPTDMQQKIRYEAGLGQQIANMIRQIDGVIDANVQLSIPDTEGGTITAAVYVKHQGVLDNPNSQLVTKIKQLVAGSVTGLKLENVTVISDRSRFTDIQLGEQQQQQLLEEYDLVSVWGVVLSKHSAGLFRFYFLLFVLCILLLIALLVFILWRLFPTIHEKGGISFLWQFSKKTEESVDEMDSRSEKQ